MEARPVSRFQSIIAQSVADIRTHVLGGGFELLPLEVWKIPHFKLMPLVSSTFTDTQKEREILQSIQFELRKDARQHGNFLHFMFIGRKLISMNQNIFQQV